MSLDQKTIVLTQLSAAVACNALASLRVTLTEALTLGISPEEIEEVLNLAKEIQQHPISHVTHLANQLLREPKKQAEKSAPNGCGCGCNGHHA